VLGKALDPSGVVGVRISHERIKPWRNGPSHERLEDREIDLGHFIDGNEGFLVWLPIAVR